MHVAYSPDTVYKDIGNSRQLFIDDDVIAVVKNVTRRQHQPRKHPANPMIRRDKPWEVTTYFRSSSYNVIWDSEYEHYKCWYADFYEYFHPGAPSRERLYYAESKDGLNWEKPALGKQVMDGHDTNAVFNPDRKMIDCPYIMLDPTESDPQRRYKLVYFNIDHGARGGGPGGLNMSYSHDGIEWTDFEGNPLIAGWRSDGQILNYDPEDRKYVLWGRFGGTSGGSAHPDHDSWFAPVWPGRPEGVWGTRRRIYRTESADLVTWSDPELLLDPGDDYNLDDGLYMFVTWRAGEIHLGLVNVLHQVDNTTEMYLLHSRDGREWKRFLDHRPFIPRGGDGAFDQLGAECTNLPLVVGDELWFYYGGMNVHHDWWIFSADKRPDVPEAHDWELAKNGHFLNLATLRLDGYVSLDATVREGWIETKPVFSTGAHLFINGRCQDNGFIKVEVMDTWNNVWDEYKRDKCDAFTGDAVRHQVSWSGRDTVNEVPGAVKLRFHLQNAELYSFQFA